MWTRKEKDKVTEPYLLAAVAGSRLCLVTPSSVVTTRGGAWRPQYRLDSVLLLELQTVAREHFKITEKARQCCHE